MLHIIRFLIKESLKYKLGLLNSINNRRKPHLYERPSFDDKVLYYKEKIAKSDKKTDKDADK